MLLEVESMRRSVRVSSRSWLSVSLRFLMPALALNHVVKDKSIIRHDVTWSRDGWPALSKITGRAGTSTRAGIRRRRLLEPKTGGHQVSKSQYAPPPGSAGRVGDDANSPRAVMPYFVNNVVMLSRRGWSIRIPDIVLASKVKMRAG